jgi:hypothetical protein
MIKRLAPFIEKGVEIILLFKIHIQKGIGLEGDG